MGLPPELKAVAPDQMRAVLEAAALVALRLTKSKRLADELLSDVFDKLTTTRRWDRSRGPLLDHVLGALRSVLNNQRTSKAPEREGVAHGDYHREVRPTVVESPEETVLEHEEAQLGRSRAARELGLLAARIDHHELAPKVLRCKSDGIAPPAEIARTLGVPVRQVYQAIDLLKYHLEKIRADENDKDE